MSKILKVNCDIDEHLNRNKVYRVRMNRRYRSSTEKFTVDGILIHTYDERKIAKSWFVLNNTSDGNRCQSKILYKYNKNYSWSVNESNTLVYALEIIEEINLHKTLNSLL